MNDLAQRIRTPWLKVIFESKHPSERYEETFVGFPKAQRPRNIQVGDHMVLYAVGGAKSVFALVEVTSEVYERSEWPHSMDVRYLVNLPVSQGVHIDEISTSKRDLLRPIRAGRSYFRLTPDEYERAVSKLKATVKNK
jgi:hypothetical protein